VTDAMPDAAADATTDDVYGPNFLDRFKSKHRAAAAAPTASDKGKAGNAPTRLPRQPGYWAPVPLAELLDRGNDEIYSARTRLLLYLAIKSRRGQRPVRLTNEMAAEIGLDRRRKCEALRYLESQGRVTVVQVGQHVPWVYLLQTPRSRELSPETDGLSRETDSSSAETDTGSPS
jgi:hypothetical protein